MKNKLKVFYWDGMKNFGDALNPLIAQKIFNIPIEKSSPKDCEAVFIGSLLDDFLYDKFFPWYKLSIKYYKKPVKIWGTGFIDNINKYTKRPFNLNETYFRNAEVYAVRGWYSKKRLEKIFNKNLDNIVLGDPGLLAPMLINIENIEKKYEIGFIPHHLEIHGYEKKYDINPEIPGLIPDYQPLDYSIYRVLKHKFKNAVIIDMEADPIDVIKRVAECKTIISSALHGLILADSLNIPNIRSTVSNLLIGNDYKFNDYYSVYDVKNNHNIIDLKSLTIEIKDLPKYIIDNYKIDFSRVKEIQNLLFNSFPYKEGVKNSDI